MATDLHTLLREAVTAILDADSGIQALTGRATRNCLPFRTGQSVTKPVILLAMLPMTPIGGAGDNRRCRFSLSCFASGRSAQATADALAERVELAITQPNLAAQGVDAYPVSTPTRSGAGEVATETPSETIARADVDLVLVATK